MRQDRQKRFAQGSFLAKLIHALQQHRVFPTLTLQGTQSGLAKSPLTWFPGMHPEPWWLQRAWRLTSPLYIFRFLSRGWEGWVDMRQSTCSSSRSLKLQGIVRAGFFTEVNHFKKTMGIGFRKLSKNFLILFFLGGGCAIFYLWSTLHGCHTQKAAC